MDEKELLANAITKGIAYQENGGKLDLDNPVAGKSGEMKSIFQFTPNTWKGYSKEAFGKEMPLNNDNETYVVKHKVKKWIDEGKTASQIASMWNAGEGHPNAYKEDWRGTNTHGVHYDTPAYAKNVLKYSKKFYQENSQKSLVPPKPIDEISQHIPMNQPREQFNGLLGKAISESKLRL